MKNIKQLEDIGENLFDCGLDKDVLGEMRKNNQK